jgi:hypothetical protein
MIKNTVVTSGFEAIGIHGHGRRSQGRRGNRGFDSKRRVPRLRTRNREHDGSLQEITRNTTTITTTYIGAGTYGNRDEEDEDEEAVLAAGDVGPAAVREAAHTPTWLQTGNSGELVRSNCASPGAADLI